MRVETEITNSDPNPRQSLDPNPWTPIPGLVLADANRRVVSMPCWELFEAQDERYRDEILPPAIKARVSIEAGVTLGWQKWVGDAGSSIGIDGRFGASAPAATVMRELGFNVGNVVEHALAAAGRVAAVGA